jgi:hypothetical protein
MNPILLALDPGNEKTAYVTWNGSEILNKGIVDNAEMRDLVVEGLGANFFVSEMVACYGMPVGREIFDTCLWIGRYLEAWEFSPNREPAELLVRRDVKLHLCNSAKARDANVRQALLDKFPAIGGGATPQIGTKKQPGPLYGVSKDIWAALGVAITFWDKNFSLYQPKQEQEVMGL